MGSPPPGMVCSWCLRSRTYLLEEGDMNGTTGAAALGSFVESMTERMATLAYTLGAWVQAEPRTLQAQEEQLLCQLHDLGTTLLSGLLALAAASAPATVTCPCGAQATFR